MKKMVVLVGIPASGKTTICKSLFSSHERISLDSLVPRTRNAEDKRLFELCKKGVDIVVDKANIDKNTRCRYIRFAKDYGYEVTALYIDTSYDQAIVRNKLRKRQVPEGGIKEYCMKLEHPSVNEGFDHVYTMWNDWMLKS